MPGSISAVVAYAPEGGKPKWEYSENIKVARDVAENELLVRMVGTGICHTDIFCSSLPHGALGITYPAAMGHEGAGVVEAVGSGVTVAKVGDRVLLSYTNCGTCDECSTGPASKCLDFTNQNISGAPGYFNNDAGEDVSGNFFGQSSFAGKSIVTEKSVVNVNDLINDEKSLQLLAPLGCGLLTGVGVILNVAQVRSHDIVLITGIGAVGFGSIMAAKNSGCKAIIAVDRVDSRLQLAKELGATHILNTTGMDNDKVAEEIKNLVKDERISVGVETTGVPPVIQAAFAALGKNGKLIQIGVPPLDSAVTFPMADLFFNNKIYVSNLLGDSDPRQIIPLMIDWWRQGKFAVDKLVKFFPTKDVLEALHGMESGSVIKPVIVW